MGAVTYPQERVAKFLQLNFIPVQLQSSNKAMMEKFAVSWTSTLIVLDADGREHYRIVGFLSPDDLIPTLETAKGRWALDTDQHALARATFEEVISCYPDSNAAAEAVFFLGVAKYKMTHDPKPLRETYDELKAKFPGSQWAKQAEHYRLINK
jgi:TolA-binding protein